MTDPRRIYAFDTLRPDCPDRRFYLPISESDLQMLPSPGRTAIVSDVRDNRKYVILGVRTDGTDDHKVLGRIVPIDEPALCEE